MSTTSRAGAAGAATPGDAPDPGPDAVAPALRVVGGNPSDEDLAALTAVLTALRRGRGRPHAPADMRIAGGWSSYWHKLTQPPLPGVNAWRSTFRR